jgi:hypothetical protein
MVQPFVRNLEEISKLAGHADISFQLLAVLKDTKASAKFWGSSLQALFSILLYSG